MNDFAWGVWGQQGRTDAKDGCKEQGEYLQKVVIFRSRDHVSHRSTMVGIWMDHRWIVDGSLTVLPTLSQQVGFGNNMS